MSKLLLIDGHAILHRAYHALPQLTTKDGEPINAVYGLVSMLLRLIQDLKPTHIAIAFDRKEPTFRKIAFEKYQSHRPETDEGLSSQFPKARDVMKAFSIPVYEMAGYEADDLIGTIAERVTRLSGIGSQLSVYGKTVVGKSDKKIEKLKTEKQKSENRQQKTGNRIDEVIIVTGDRDILQLVNDKVKVLLPTKGLSEGKLMDVADVMEKMECLPEQIPDYKALVGDSSDNYPGVPGIGPKTAAQLLFKYGSFKNIYKHLDEIPENTRKKLVEGKESGEMSLHLAKIVTDVDVEIELDGAKKWQVDSGQVLDLFSEYGFKTLTKRVQEVGKTIASENQGSLF
jgi:DNA polymerase I